VLAPALGHLEGKHWQQPAACQEEAVTLHPGVDQAVALANDLQARGVARKAGHAVLIIVIVLIVVGVLLGVGLTTLLRRRRR